VVRSVRNGRISLPPRATSPIKTHLNSSPRRSTARSVGPMSSPSRNFNNGTPTRAVSHPPNDKPVNRQLDFSMEMPQESIEYSPQKAPSTMKPPKLAAAASKGRNKRAFDLSIGADDPEDLETDAFHEANTTNGIDYGGAEVLPNGDEQIMFDQSLGHGALEETYREQQSQSIGEEDIEMVDQGAKAVPKDGRSKKGGRRAPTAPMVHDESQIGTPRRGRPPKKSKPPVYQDPDAGPVAAPSKAAGNMKKPPPKQRDPNARIIKRNTSKQPSIRSASIGPRSTFLQRSETPANDDGALVTRSGRHSFKPLKSWLGEKLVMGDRTVDALPAIKEVLRVDEVIEPRTRRPAHRRPKRRVRSQLSDVDEEDDEEDERDEWELVDGIKTAEVMDWDPNTNKYDEENTREEGKSSYDTRDYPRLLSQF
jgi:hypothetical protein